MSLPAILQVEDLHVTFNSSGGVVHPVRGVSFELRAGETLGIAGESGSGKSLSLMAVLGLLPRHATREAAAMRYGDQDLIRTNAREMRKIMATGMATIFQDPMTSLNPVLSIGSLLEEVYLCHLGGTRAAARERAKEMLERVQIPNASSRLRQFPHELSGGQRQRVMIAMALMCNPKVLIADEPTTALDVTVQAGILDLLEQLQQDLGLAVVLVSHDLGVISRLSHRVAVMYCGQVIETGPAKTVLKDPHHPYTRALMQCIPGLRIGRRSARLSPIPGQVPVMSGDLTGCQFRDRCGFSQAMCSERDPSPRQAGTGWTYRCHFDPADRLESPKGVPA